MVVVKLYGGLGNQMFQYAAGRALVSEPSSQLMYEGEYFRSPEKFGSVWPYQLNVLKTHCEEWKHPVLPEKVFNYYFRLLRKLDAKGLKVSRKYFFEKSEGYDEKFHALKGDIFLNGYFQSEKYFLGIKNVLQEEFTPRENIGTQNEKIIDEMKSQESVSLHFRRGDYISNPEAAKVHGLCSPEYYQKALETISQQKTNLHFYLFSDDPNWVKENIKINGALTVVDHNKGMNSFLDMYLMSQCKHNITANSSFSWWGAWLNRNPSKIVIAPQKWYASKDYKTDSLVPQSWLRI